MLAASRAHSRRRKQFEQQDQLEAALGEYKQATEFDPSNRLAAAKVAELDRTIRDRIEAARPKPADRADARAGARGVGRADPEPGLARAAEHPLQQREPARHPELHRATRPASTSCYDREFQDRPTTVQLDGVTLEQALNQILTTNQLSYKVLERRSIFVFPDTPPKHAQYDEQVIRTFYLSHADATELSQILSTIIRLPGIAVQPAIAANKTANTITVRGTQLRRRQILEKIIEQNDKPRAEVVVDVEILEVDRTRTKNYGLNLSEYALGGVFSPEVSPSATTDAAGDRHHAGTTSRPARRPAPSRVEVAAAVQPEHDLARREHGRLLPRRADRDRASSSKPTRTRKLIAKPQLRGAEGTKLTLKLGHADSGHLDQLHADRRPAAPA